MGQLIEKDHRPQLPNQIPKENVKLVSKKKPFEICPFLEFDPAERIFFVQDEEFVEALYKFGPRHTVHLQLKKEQSKRCPGIYLKLGDQYVYAYKHRKLDRSDNIKPEKLMFKKRMYLVESEIREEFGVNQPKEIEIQKRFQEKLMKKFAQVKFLSLLQIGPKLGRVYNGCDGVITPLYIEYFSQVTIDRIQNCIATNSELKKLQKRMIELNIFSQGLLRNENLSYSRWRKGYVLKQLHYYEPNQHSTNHQSYDNQSIHFIVRMFETEITKVVMDLDNQAKMLPFINNLIFQHDYEKAISKFQESLPMIEDDQQKIQFAEEVSSMISKHSNSGDREYENKIQKIVANSTLKQNSKHSINSAKVSKNSTKLSLPSLSTQAILSPEKTLISSEKHIDLLLPVSEDGLALRTEYVIQKGGNKSVKIDEKNVKNLKQIQQAKQHEKKVEQDKQRAKKSEFFQLCRVLKKQILDKNNQKMSETLNQLEAIEYKSHIQIQILFGKLLIQNARSRHALTVFQRLLYSMNEVAFSQIYHYYQIALLAGVIYFHRFAYKKSLKAFQKALNILVRLRHYSIKMMTIHNNIACIHHVMKDYDQSLFHLHKGFRLGEYSVDFEYLMRSNMAMALVEKGRIKDAKHQMMKVNKIVQPINNMVVYCKFYSNLAYLQLIDPGDSKSIDKVITNFEQACNVQQKYLIPNGYKPSIFLHNNIAMLHYKRKEFKKAKLHCEKIINQLNDVDGLVGVKVHFNIGKIFSQGYNYDLPLKHFHQAYILLAKMDQNKEPMIRTYKEIIGKEIQDLEKMRIDEVSQEESYKFSYMSSSLLKKV